jgi:transaldolase
MEIWLDTIDAKVIADGEKTGVISGVTTNPSILSNTSDVFETLSELLDIQSGPVAVQVTSTDPQGMFDEASHIFEFSPRMIIKVPINRNGLIAIKQLQREKIPVLGTGILFSTQALLASNLGTSYISPYFSHMGDVGDAFETLQTIVDILRVSSSSTKVLVASLNQLNDIGYCASIGVAAVTIKPDLYYKLMADHPIVEGFFQKFLLDWTQTHGHLSIKEVLSRIKELN